MNEQKAFLSINEAATATGLARSFLRNGCRSGTVPHIMAGCKYLVNVPALMEQLDAQSRSVGV